MKRWGGFRRDTVDECVSTEERSGEEKILKRKSGTHEWRDEGRGGRERSRQESRVIKVLDGRERGSWRTATERWPRRSQRFSGPFLLGKDTQRHSGGERLARNYRGTDLNVCKKK